MIALDLLMTSRDNMAVGYMFLFSAKTAFKVDVEKAFFYTKIPLQCRSLVRLSKFYFSASFPLFIYISIRFIAHCAVTFITFEKY